MTTHLPLLAHPDTPTSPVHGIQVAVAFTPDGALALSYTLAGELSRIRIPEPGPGERGDGLWRHTCCEVFIAGDDGPAYREFNFSPSGAWQAYGFRGYRDGGLLEPATAPALNRRGEQGRLVLDCLLPGAALPPGRVLRLGLCAVVEDTDGALSYWALRHAPGRPDFHHTDAFVLELRRP